MGCCGGSHGHKNHTGHSEQLQDEETKKHSLWFWIIVILIIGMLTFGYVL